MNVAVVIQGRRRAELLMWPKLHGLELLHSIESRTFETLPFIVIDAETWATKSEDVLRTILDAALGQIVVVRSCAAMEDTITSEPPGFFDSILNVRTNAPDIKRAIDTVIASYARRAARPGVPDKVIIQQQLMSPGLCGVCRVGTDEDDYIEIDCDDTLERTDAVTAGVKARRVVLSPCLELLPSPWLEIRRCADQLREHFTAPFFIEFALNAAGVPTVFQIRPDRRLKVAPEAEPPLGREALTAAAAVVEASGPLSVMADWNPAEMLGLRPMPLDISLYDELVMRGAWADGRASIGWHEPSDRNLMAVVAGRPYVKIALSLQSLLPRDLPRRLAERLVRDRLAMLSADRQLHDKIEFRLMWSAFAFNQEAVERDLRRRGFSPEDIQQLFAALRTVTRQTLERAPRLLEADRRSVARLQAERKVLVGSEVLSSPAEAAQVIRTAIAVCRTYGTVPFSRQARLAFTFRYIINHLIEGGDVRLEAVACWQSRLNTVARELSRDLARIQKGKQTAEAFLRRYGHLRPSTYNLESLRYDERPLPVSERSETNLGPTVAPGESRCLATILKELGSTCAQSEFWAAAAGAYKGREELKFGFTALLSDILRALAEVTQAAGLERRDVRRVPIGTLLAMMDQVGSWRDFGRLVADWPTAQAPLWPRLRLPDVIFGSRDLHVISEPDTRPTFVGNQSVAGAPCSVYGDSSAEPGALSGAIVAIETPDPGYDWVFAHRLGGLITAYGGEFSHMGLRCAEFGLPAVLGCGPSLFTSAVNAEHLKLDPQARELWADGKRLVPP